jgi:hypothetical protein
MIEYGVKSQQLGVCATGLLERDGAAQLEMAEI